MMGAKINKKTIWLVVLAMLVQFAWGCTGLGDNSDTEYNASDISSRKAVSESEYELKKYAVEGNRGLYELDYDALIGDDAYILNFLILGDKLGIFYEREGDLGSGVLVINPFEHRLVKNIEFTDMYIYPDIKVSSYGRLAVYDPSECIFYYYNDDFEVEKKVQLDCENSDRVVISDDIKYVYYYDSVKKKVMAHSLEDESASVVFDMGDSDGEYLTIDGVIKDEYMLYNYYMADSTSTVYEMREISTGEVIWQETSPMYNLFSVDGAYILNKNIDGVDEIVCGENIDGQKLLTFNSSEEYSYAQPDDRLSSVVSIVMDDDGSKKTISLNDYSLKTGKREKTALLNFDAGRYDDLYINYVAKSALGNYVALSVSDTNNHIFIYDLMDAESVSDGECYLISLDELSDEKRINELKQTAKNIGDKYGVEIYVADDIENCTMNDQEYAMVDNSVRIKQALNIIDEVLSVYPDGMLAQLDDDFGSILKIYLSGTIKGTTENTLEYSVGIQCTMTDDTYLVVDITNQIELKNTLYHEIYHAIENHLSNEGVYFDYGTWGSLNPEGFDYDYDYRKNEKSNEYDYVLGDENGEYFIDVYSKSFPFEDRARLIEYAMEYPEVYRDEHLREKLSYVCDLIRLGFNTEGWPDVTAWEKVIR